MKLRFIFILLFVFGVGAQRRNSKSETETETSSHRPIGRGRAKFTLSAEAIEEIRTDSDRSASTKSEKKKAERRISRPNSRPYEVEEIIDDIPNENARKVHKPRVITETRFEAANAPKKPLFIPVPLPEEEFSPEELLASFGPPVVNTEKTSEHVKKTEKLPVHVKKTEIPTVQVSSVSPVYEVPITLKNIDTSSRIIPSTPELTTASEQPSSTENELKKIPLEIVTPITPLPEPRKISTVKTYVKPRVTSEEAVTTATRNRPRGRPSRRQETDSSENTSSNQSGRSRSRLSPDSGENVSRVSRARVTRRRLESADSSEAGIKGRGPSVLSTASSQELPTRSRTGRKVTPLQGSSSERKEVRAAEEKTYTIRSRRIETKTQQLHFESTNDLSKPVSEEKVEAISEEVPSEISRVTKRRRPSHANTDEATTKSNQSRTVTSRNNRNRNSRNRSTEAKQTTENRRDTGRRRNRKQEERSTPANNVNSERGNVIRSRKPEPNVNVNQEISGKINEVPITESIATKKLTEIPHLEKMSIVESDVLKSESVENRKFINRFSYEPFGSESTTKGLEFSDKQINSRSRGESSLENKALENKRPLSRNRPETENPVQKSDKIKKEITTEGALEKKTPTSTVGRRKLQIDENSTQQAQTSVNSETTTETKRQKNRTENVEKNVPIPNSRKVDEIPLAENHIKTFKTLEQKRVNTKIKEEKTSTQNVETTDNKRSRSRISDVRRNNRKQEPRSEARTASNESNSRRRSQSKAVSTEAINRESSTERFDKFRTRHRTRFMLPIIDEQKLEVLPLFESEAKTVGPISDSSERRKMNSLKDDFISASTTEHVVKSATNNEISKGFPHRRGQVVRVETVTEKSEEINIQKRKPIIRESVESEVSEGVSSRQLVSTNKTGSGGVKINKERKVTIKVGTPKVTITEVVNVSRGNKKADIKSTEEADEESDNYPEPFKALIQAKLTKPTKKGSRTRSSAESVTTGSEKVMTSSVIKTTPPSLSTQPSAFSGRVEDVDNELIPKNNSTPSTTSLPRSSTRRRFSLATKNPLTVDTAPSSLKKLTIPSKNSHLSLHISSQGSTENTSFSPKDSRYHARFASEILDKIPTDPEHKLSVSTTGTGRSFTSKPTRSAYSTRKNNKKVNGNLRQKIRSGKPDLSSVKISSLGAITPKKPVRYSARYRSDIFSRTGSTRPTPAPVYIPTVPTVTPSSVTQVKSGLAIEENVSGMEVISIDEPVNTIPSDSLVNGELLTPSNPFAPPSILFPASLVTRNGASTTAQSIISKTAEKPVSIIERIIYSITAISTTTAPDVTIDSITNVGPTKSSAIFKIPNKTTKTSGTTDVTFDETLGRQDPLFNQIESSTTEKPTTIIERILSSLSAIQADNSSVSQVGNNVSSISTTFSPIARFTSVSSTVSTSLPPVTTPSTDPLVVLEQISSEQSLQERTIAKLLELLKSITTTTPKQDDVVIVTPKVTSFVSSTADIPIIVENPDVEVFNVSSNVITNNPEKQVVPNVTTTTDTSANSLPDNTETNSTSETTTTTTSATVQTENTSPNIAENSIIQEILTTEPITTQAMSPQNLNSKFSQAISLTDYIASLTAKPESTSSIPETTPAALQETTSSDNNQPSEPSQVPANSAASNVTEITETNDINSVDVDINTVTPSSADQISQVTTESTQAQPVNELNTTENDKSNTVTINADNSNTTTDLSQTQAANVTEFADTSTKLNNSEISVITESAQISENQLQTTEEIKIATTTQTSQTIESSQTSAVSAVESGEPNVTMAVPSQTSESQTIAATQSNDTVATTPVNVELPTTNPTVQLPTTLSEQLARIMAANLGTPNMVSTTLSIEQTSVHNPVTDSDTTATIPQLPTLMNFEADTAAQNTASSVEANQLTVDSTTSQPQPPAVATLPTLTDLLGGKTVQAFNDIINQTNGDRANKVQTLDVDPMIQSRARDVEEVNIEENTISSSGNTGPEKIIEATTTPLPPNTTRPTPTATPASIINEQMTNAPITTAPPATRPPTTTVPTTIRPPTTTVPTTIRPRTTTRPPTTTAPTTVAPPLTTTAIPLTAKPLTTLPPTTLPTMFVESIRSTLPKTAEDLATNNPAAITTAEITTTPAPTQNPSALTTQSIMDQTQTPQDVVMAERDVETTPVTDTVTIPPPILASRIQETVGTRPTTLNTEPITEPIVTTSPQAFERLRNTMPTTETPSVIQRISKKPRNQQRGPTTTPQTTQPLRTRMRTIPTTTMEPTTITIPPPNTMIVRTTSQPIRTTTIVSRRYTNTPTTVNTPRRRVTTMSPRIRLTTTPSITEQTVIANNYMTPTTTPRIFEASTVFPVYTRPTVDYNSLETTNPPTTKFVTTFRSRSRQTGSTLPPDLTTILTTNQNLERLAQLRVDENYGELSTTGDYLSPTTLSPSVSTIFNPVTLQTTLKSINSKVRLLTDQQKKDLEELVRLEEEQKAILQQLAFLTKLNLGGGPKPSRSPSNLASRVLDFAAERNKGAPPSNILEALTASNSRESKKITSAEGKNPTVEEVLKQLNVNPNSVTVSSLSSTYGKSTDAILAALLKEQGIGPSTPKALGDQLKTTTPFETSTTKKVVLPTKRRTTTTPRPGPLMQGLNWLLNALGPQPTTSRRPPLTTRRTTTVRPITAPFDVELLTNQPTEISPVVVTAPPRIRASASTQKQTAAISSRPKRPLHSLSESELQSLITQLETIQKDPTKAKSLDFSALKLTEMAPTTTTIIANNAVQITNSGKVGSSSKLQLPSPEITTTKSGITRSTTGVPLGVSNSILDDAKEEPTKPPQRRPNLPPLKLSPVHGLDDEQEPQVRGQLINAAVNVTKAISQFLGSAIQDAAYQLTNIFSNGSGNLRSYFSSSSVLPTITPRVNSSG